MRLNHALTFLALACGSLVGCARTESFDINVRNDTRGPLTIALTKDGPPFEQKWLAPEDLAIESPKADEQHGYAVLAPGQQADVSVRGKFDQGTRGYLRAYRGDLLISDMLAVGPASPNRVDVPLNPGGNEIVIGDHEGRLAPKRFSEAAAAGPTTAPAAAGR